MTSFQPGNDFGKGRPSGARNKSSYELRERLKARGDIDPAEFLSSIVSNENESKELRIAASDKLLPYYYSKLGAIPVPIPPQYMQDAVSLPRPTDIRSAYENILKLSEMKAQGQLDVATADSLITDQRTVLNAMVDEAKLIAANADPNRVQKIQITGGLPELPGTNIIGPQINGHTTIDPEGNLIPPHPVNEDPKEPLSADQSLPVNHDPQAPPIDNQS